MTQYLKNFSTLETPQTQPMPGEEDVQVKNNAGGYVYQISKLEQLKRFLILGTEGGTYYVGERKFTEENARNIMDCCKVHPIDTVKMILEISDSGRAPKNDPAIFALAVASSVPETKTLALANLGVVCRIPTHIFHFVEYCRGLRGWGRALRRAVGNWYLHRNSGQPRSPQELAHMLVKYQQRDGWSNRDVLAKSHPTSTNPHVNGVLRWAAWTQHPYEREPLPEIIEAYEEAKTAPRKDVVRLILKHGLTREMIPSEHLKDPQVWSALLQKMPMTAMIRNLGNMTKVGALEPFSPEVGMVCDKITDGALLRKARIHPLFVLNALKTYESGAGQKGSGSWTPIPNIVDALNDAFYTSFGNVEPTRKNILLALDVSGSMGWGTIAGTSITPREAAAVLAMVTARVEPNYLIMAFSDELVPVSLTKSQQLADVVRTIDAIPMGRTDCSLPAATAAVRKLPVDAFCIYTDNETWSGYTHPKQALARYRQTSGRAAKQVVVGMTATKFSIADPKDPLSLDVVGFDMATPQAISEFIR